MISQIITGYVVFKHFTHQTGYPAMEIKFTDPGSFAKLSHRNHNREYEFCYSIIAQFIYGSKLLENFIFNFTNIFRNYITITFLLLNLLFYKINLTMRKANAVRNFQIEDHADYLMLHLQRF